MKLSEAQKNALIEIGFGVRGYADGYYSDSDPTRKINTRTIAVLHRLELVTYFGTGGSTNTTMMLLTDKGEQIFEELRYR